MMTDMALHAKKIRYQNLLDVTLLGGNYTIKEFFKIVEAEGIDFDPDCLLDGTDDTFGDEHDQKLVKLAKERLYPYRYQAANEADPVDATYDEKKAKKEAKEPMLEKIGDGLFALYDAPRRMACGMKPFDIEIKAPKDAINDLKDKKDQKKKEKEQKKEEKKTQKEQKKEERKNKKEQKKAKKENKKEEKAAPVEEHVEAEVVSQDGKVETKTEVVVDPKQPEPQPNPALNEAPVEPEGAEKLQPESEVKKKVFQPVNGVVNIDIQRDFDMIIAMMKDRVKKGTTIDVMYNYVGSSFTVALEFPDGVKNNLMIDARVMLPDYYSILVSDKKYGTLAVPIESRLATEIINKPMYQVSEEEVKAILKKYYFNDIGLYYVFDFSTFKGLNKMDKKKKKRLEEILTKLCDDLRDKRTQDIPRFRFLEYRSPEDFVIISDNKTKSPLAHLNETSCWINYSTFDVKDGVAYMRQEQAVQQMVA